MEGLAGLASGFDWRTMIDQLMAAERVPQQQLRADQRENDTKLTALDRLESKLDALKSNIGGMDESSVFNAKSTSLSDDTLGISATAGTSASIGTYSFNISQLATASSRSGSADVGGSIGSTSTVLTNLNLATPISEGTFTVNGEEITVADTDTLQDVLDAISVATSGVVTGSYDAGTDKISLTSASGELELGSEGDTSNFLEALRLDQNDVIDAGGGSTSVTSSRPLGVVDLSVSIASSTIGGGSVTGAGTFMINGVAIDFDADTESMSTLMGRVNDSSANVTMTYDSAADQFKIVNNDTGAYAMHVTDSGNGMLAALGLDGAVDLGDDLQFTIDGGTLQSSRSNTIKAEDHGIQGLTIDAYETGTQVIGIGRDTSELRDKIDSFIQAYNDVQDYIQEQTKIEVTDDEVDAATLAGNREISALDTQLRTMAFQAIEGMTGDIFRLEHMGIDFRSGTSKLEIKDSSALDEALANNIDELETFFTQADTGFVARMDDYIENFTASNGILDTQKDSLRDQNSRIDTQIEDMERRLEFQESALEASFIAMETAQSNIQRQQSALSSLSF